MLEAEWEKRKQIVRDTGKIKTNDLLVNATLTLVKTNHTINEELGKMVTKEQIAGMQGQMLQMATKESLNKSLYAMGITIITIMTFVIAVLKFLI